MTTSAAKQSALRDEIIRLEQAGALDAQVLVQVRLLRQADMRGEIPAKEFWSRLDALLGLTGKELR